jgi:hypothetical protein
MKGTAKASGNAYEMCNLVIETKQESVASVKMQRVGLGLDTKELQMEFQAFERLSKLPVVYPFLADLEVGSTVGFRGLEAIITGVTPVQLKAAA